MTVKNKRVVVQGTVERVIYTNPENGYAVVRLHTQSGKYINVVGCLERRHRGEFLRLEGRWMHDPRWGQQFEVESYTVSEPRDSDSMKRYLASELVEGIGPEMAERLVEHFGNNVITVVRENPDRLREVSGIGKKRAKAIRDAILGEDREKRIMRELSTRLMDFGIGTARIRKIYKRYGDASLDILNRDPYRLAGDIYGIGFATADHIARRMNIPKDAPTRLRAGLLHALYRSSDEGHCFLPTSELIEQAERLLDVPAETLLHPLRAIAESGAVSAIGDRIYPARLFVAEATVAERLNAILNAQGAPLGAEFVESALKKQQRQMDIEFTSEQSDAVRKILCQTPVLVLTGGPGTGKTTIIRAAAHIARSSRANVILCAPTGRAANRLSEMTDIPAYTIHRLLEYTPQTGFSRGISRPIRAQFVVVDEMSMVDIELFSALLAAIRPGTRLLLVGDADQLPSVGPGQVLSDLIASEVVPTERLTIIHRQAAKSRIIREAHNILRGQIPSLKNDPKADFFFLQEDDPEKGMKTVVDLVSQRLPERYGLDPSADIQVIVPMYRGVCGANILNEAIRERINPRKPTPPFKFSVGDKVMQTRNNYDLNIFNGDIGVVVKTVTDGKNSNSQPLLIVKFDVPVAYTPEDASELTTAYAITVHKSQGNEMPCVIIPLYTEHYILLRRHLLYTAITRAKKLCVIVGQVRALDIAVGRAPGSHRYSTLAERIKKIYKSKPGIPGMI